MIGEAGSANGYSWMLPLTGNRSIASLATGVSTPPIVNLTIQQRIPYLESHVTLNWDLALTHRTRSLGKPCFWPQVMSSLHSLKSVNAQSQRLTAVCAFDGWLVLAPQPPVPDCHQFAQCWLVTQSHRKKTQGMNVVLRVQII
ncbi:uncharacterized protein CANTADRAFT_302031 [Suhomyces tanzawaensis NRRL Y-17324]|uniref:Uncharacterized protein n=1 Tax=Suhomyces tanzawaensis NRRL Y-17324 TaxID=984487 RepID=A0A1E4SCJ0_9ASCO|nr:uncharacterized protein CANTADRAFT_302031 [Suhomyces tanzawaensis NRRL Y-17324]ODV77219.1 hypothetical protein CANTADRAFT_302031 [Suhomyces tanzawaensis NRRL Y-17324]